MKKITLWFFVLVLVVSSISLQGCEKKDEEKSEKIKVVATMYPQYDFVREIAGDKVDLKLLLKPGSDSHSYEPSPQDLLDIKKCDVFIYLGGHGDTWVDEIIESAGNKDMKVIAMTSCVKPLKQEITEGMEHNHDHEGEGHHDHEGEEHHDHEGEEHHDHEGEEHHNHEGEEHHDHEGEEHHDHEGEEHHDHEGEEHHDHEGEEHHDHEGEEHHDHESETKSGDEKICHLNHSYDAHVWTSPANAVKIVREIEKALSEKDSKNADFYKNNSQKYIEKLNKLDKDIKKVVKESKRDTIIVADRFPFRYFVDRYKLKYYAAFSGCSGQTDASASAIAFMVEKIREEKVKAIVTIEMSDQKMAKAISEETGVKILTLHSLHNVTQDEYKNKTSYLQIMENNKKVLKEVLN